MTLTKDRFEKARAFVKQNARRLDLALFAFYFENGAAAAVLDALAAYQNGDGGFGHAVEPDIRLPDSSPLVTSVALQYAVAVDAPADHPLIAPAMRYLAASYDQAAGCWYAVPPAVNDFPRAPWWTVGERTPPQGADWANPTAELLGYLHRYRAHVDPSFLDALTARAHDNLRAQPHIEGRYNLLCWQRAAVDLPPALRDEALSRLDAAFARLSTIGEKTFDELPVAAVAPTPDSPLARRYPDAVRRQIEAEVARQAEDGGWHPGWGWGQYEDVWPIAEREWAGKITVETLHALRQYDLLAQG